MSQSDEELSNLYNDEENSINHSDEEGEDIAYHRRGNQIDEDDDDDDDDDDGEDEEEEEEDEEEARKIAEGFIVEDDEESDASEVAVRKKKRKKVEDFDEDLDEEDLELLEENTGIKIARSSGPKLKRLKRGREEQTYEKAKHQSIFSDEEEDEEAVGGEGADMRGDRHQNNYADTYNERARYRRRDAYDDMGDFIADEDEDEDDIGQNIHDRGRARDEGRSRRGKPNKEMMEILPEGMSEDVLADMFDIFGDGGDYEWALYDEEENEEAKDHEPQLEDIFEPSELAERMMTERDEAIRLLDVPERLQVRYEGVKVFPKASNDAVQEEGVWIARMMARQRGEEQPAEEYISAVAYVVNFLRREFLEVPYIKDHRRDFFTEVNKETGLTTEILTEKDLWEIYDLDYKYHSFGERRMALRDFITKCDIEDDYVNHMLDRAEKVEEVTDITDYVNMKYSEHINRLQQQTRGSKRPTNKSLRDLTQGARLQELLPIVSISPREFGTNYLEGNRRYVPDDPTVDPLVHADLYTDTHFPDTTRVLKAVRSILAQEVALDPQVRKAMRRDWEIYATITVRPTEQGFTVIDELHPMYPFKFITEKPITAFTDGQFLHILKGEADKLLTVHVGMTDYDVWSSKIADYYLSDGFSDTIVQWNDQRREVIQQALNEHLIPLITKYIREKLRMEAQEAICQAAFHSLYNKINVGPYKHPEAHYKSPLPRVITLSSGNGGMKDPIVAVCLNPRGRVVDQIEVPTLKEERYWTELSEFIKAKKAHVVGVAGYNAETRRVIKHMQTMLSEINQSNEQNSIPKLDMVVVNDEAARLYKNSRRAQEEFPEYSEATRYCIALARRLQNPVLEYAGLGRDLLAIHHHDLQHLVPEETLLFYLERALISVVNDLGFDVNAAIQNPYVANALQYVCGFGPRKAQTMMKKVEATGRLESRTALVMRKLTAANTFMNCASYIRIRDMEGADILDDTRIHPENYDLARKMAADALEIDEDEMDDYDSKVAVVTRVIKEYPDKLNDLILDDYAVVLRKQYNAPKRQILEHIKLELQGPYHDRRNRYSRPTPEEAFTMVTGETRQSLSEGFIIPAKIVAIRNRYASCVLDSGLDGTIFIDNASDDRVMSISDVLQVGQTVTCKVLRIDRERFMVELSCKPSDTKPGSDIPLRQWPQDSYFDRLEETKVREQLHTSRRKQARSTRVIKHPFFRPFNHIEAEDYLTSRQRGEYVIRPSSHGRDHIAITWKVAEDAFQHVDVVEVRDKNDIHAPAQYRIGKYVFEDLDELIVNYVEAIARKVEELMGHKKFVDGGSRALNNHLTALTQANPKMSAYGFCLSEKPGYFDLGFKLNARGPPMRWIVKVLPDGYRLRDVFYTQVDQLINGFKQLQVTEAQKHKQRSNHHHHR